MPFYVYILREVTTKNIIAGFTCEGYPGFGHNQEYKHPWPLYNENDQTFTKIKNNDTSDTEEVDVETLIICLKEKDVVKLKEKYPDCYDSLFQIIQTKCNILEDEEGYWFSGKLPFDIVGGIEGKEEGEEVDIILKPWKKPSWAKIRNIVEKPVEEQYTNTVE